VANSDALALVQKPLGQSFGGEGLARTGHAKDADMLFKNLVWNRVVPRALCTTVTLSAARVMAV
jgi:hypothetical protein